MNGYRFTHPLLASVGLAAWWLGSAASADLLTEWGTQAITSVADCPSFCTNFNFGPTAGGQLQATASTSVSEFRGDAAAEALLSGGLSVPILRSIANASPASKGAFGSAFGSQGYTYNGPDTTLSLDATLTGSLIDPAVTSSSVRATVVVFEVESYEFFPDLPTLIFEIGATPVQQTGGLGEAIMEFRLTDTGAIDETQSVTFEASDGDQFYIWASLDTDARSSSTVTGVADAFNTLTVAFEDGTGLTPAGVAIPEPASVVLAALGLLAVGRLRR